MSKTTDKASNEPIKHNEVDEMFRKLEEKGDYSGIENFSAKVIPKIAKIINKLHPEQNSFTGFVKKDEEKENTVDNVGYYFYTSTEPVIELGKKKQPLEVSISSTEQENEQLLHFLFDKSRLANDDERPKQLPSKKSEAEYKARDERIRKLLLEANKKERELEHVKSKIASQKKKIDDYKNYTKSIQPLEK